MIPGFFYLPFRLKKNPVNRVYRFKEMEIRDSYTDYLCRSEGNTQIKSSASML
jgi:hypothetical protein